VAPGRIWNPLKISGGAQPKKYTKLGGDYPLCRPGEPVDFTFIYVQLASEDASYTAGKIYGAGGGKGSSACSKSEPAGLQGS
jgi:hypothetical protein